MKLLIVFVFAFTGTVTSSAPAIAAVKIALSAVKERGEGDNRETRAGHASIAGILRAEM